MADFTPYTPTAAASAQPSGATPSAPTTPTASASFIPYTPGQTTPVPQLPNTPAPVTPTAPTPSGFFAPSEQGAQGEAQAIQEGIQNVKNAPTFGGQLLAAGQAGLRAVGAVAGGVVGQIAKPLQPAIDFAKSRLPSAMAATATTFTGIPYAQTSKAVQAAGDYLNKNVAAPAGQLYKDFATQHPDLVENIAAGANIGSLLTMTPAAEATGGIAKTLPIPGEIKTGILGTPEARSQGVADSLAKEWTRPTTVKIASYNKARDILSTSPEAPTTLGQLGIAPTAYIDDGRYNTSDVADSLRATAGKMSSDALRPSLHYADYSTPKTPVSDIQIPDSLIQAQGKGVTPDDMEAIKTQIDSKLAALQRRYPDGMGLENMHDEKITYAQNGKFSPVGDSSVDNKAIANRSIASILAKQVEDKAPAEIPVGDLNKQLSKYYKAADYLESLDTKKVPTTLGQTVRGAILKYGTAKVAETFGGGIVSAFAGYSVGKAFEHILENMSSPLRQMYLRNLRVTNPEAFNAVQTYLQKSLRGETTMPLLPAATATQLPAETPRPIIGRP